MKELARFALPFALVCLAPPYVLAQDCPSSDSCPTIGQETGQNGVPNVGISNDAHITVYEQGAMSGADTSISTALQGIDNMPDIIAALEDDRSKLMSERQEGVDSAIKRLKEIELSKLEAYRDFKRGVIDEALWSSLRDGWNGEELQLRATVEAFSSGPLASQIDSVRKTFELAQFAYSKWDTLINTERAKIAKIVLSNCVSDGVTLSFQYRKPFDLIVERGKNEDWRREGDSNPR